MHHAGKGAGKGEAEELAASTHDKAGALSQEGLKRASASGNPAFGVQLWGLCRVSLRCYVLFRLAGQLSYWIHTG